MTSTDRTFHPWSSDRMITEVQMTTLDKALHPELPAVAKGPTFAIGRDLSNLACTSKGMCALVKGYAQRSETLLGSGLEPPSETASEEHVSQWCEEWLKGTKHLVFATGSTQMMEMTSPSFATAAKLLKYLSAHPSDHTIETITFDERIRDDIATAEGTDILNDLVIAAKALASSKPDEPIRLQVHSHPQEARYPEQYLFAGFALDGKTIILDETSWAMDFDDAPGFSADSLTCELRRRRNFDRSGCDVDASLKDFERWCRKQFQLMLYAEKKASPGTTARCSITVNLHATAGSSEGAPDLPAGGDAPAAATIKTNSDIRYFGHQFQAVIDKVAAEYATKQPGGFRSSMTLNAGTCDQKAYTVEGYDN